MNAATGWEPATQAGIYPDRSDSYTFHLIRRRVDSAGGRSHTQQGIFYGERRIPVKRIGPTNKHRSCGVTSVLLVVLPGWRMARPMQTSCCSRQRYGINRLAPRATVMSCGKNMGVFKGVGYPEEIAEFFQLTNRL